MARKLKGKSAEKAKINQREKMKKTLKAMDAVREVDNINLRDLIKKKMIIHQQEREKAEKSLIELQKQIEQLKELKLKIDGALISLNEVLKESSQNAD